MINKLRTLLLSNYETHREGGLAGSLPSLIEFAK